LIALTKERKKTPLTKHHHPTQPPTPPKHLDQHHPTQQRNANSPLGQLLVWEWQSETYVLKQQGHADSVAAVAFSPDGQVGR